MPAFRSNFDSLTAALATFRRQDATDWSSAWVGIEPTFQTAKSVKKWRKMAAKPCGEDAYFESRYMLDTQKNIAKAIKKKYESCAERGKSKQRRGKLSDNNKTDKDHLDCCMFARVERQEDMDQWDVRRQNLLFHWPGDKFEPFEVRFTLDPETFEYSIKPVPLAWLYDDRFVSFMQEFLWDVPLEHGLTPSIAHGGAQFSFSAKTFLTASLLADDIAYKLNHPELSMWIMDWPNPDDRAFRATRPRFEAFRDILQQYWAGRFHPRAIGVLTAENAFLDRGFGPACAALEGLMNDSGPTGSPRDVFQTNFAFGRAVRLRAQNVHPGYWQSAHPLEEGYRPDQIMRYSEGNLNRLQIAGEFHVKSGKVLDPDRSPELHAPLDLELLTEECSWENRGQMSRTSARDFVEALLLDVHHAQYLQAHPRVAVSDSILQDCLLGNAEKTMEQHGGGAILERLHKQARKKNLEDSRGRLKSDCVEPEALFWAAWKVLPADQKTSIAHEVILGFVERVQQAATTDPRPEFQHDPMEWHRHRIHPVLWNALEQADTRDPRHDPVQHEFETWRFSRDLYLKRRPVFSQAGDKPPWERS